MCTTFELFAYVYSGRSESRSRVPSGQRNYRKADYAVGDDDVKQMTASFFQALGNVTARRGSEFVLGDRGRPEHLAPSLFIGSGLGATWK